MEDLDIIEAVDQLPDKYIKYELQIRQVRLLRSTAASRKRALIGFLRREAETQQPSDMVLFMPLRNDLDECKKLLSEIEMEMAVAFDEKVSACEVQLNYLRERIERLNASPSPDLFKRRANLLNRISELEKPFSEVTVTSGLDVRCGTLLPRSVTRNVMPRLNSIRQVSSAQGISVPVFSSTTGQNLYDSSIDEEQNSQAHEQPQRQSEPNGPEPVNAHNDVEQASLNVSVDSTSIPNPLPPGTLGVNSCSNATNELQPVHGLSHQTQNTANIYDEPLRKAMAEFERISLLHDAAGRGKTMSMSQSLPNPVRTSETTNLQSTKHKLHAQMWKWAIRFSGDGDEMSASDFIQSLKDLAQSRGVPLDEVLKGMPELLTGSAAKWYRNCKMDRPFVSFKDFANRFQEDFEQYFKTDRRLEKLKMRLQGPQERVVAFFAHMVGEFNLMNQPPCEPERIRIIYRNLLPQYVTHLACKTFRSVSDLQKACKLVEASYEMVRSQNSMRNMTSAGSPAARGNFPESGTADGSAQTPNQRQNPARVPAMAAVVKEPGDMLGQLGRDETSAEFELCASPTSNTSLETSSNGADVSAVKTTNSSTYYAPGNYATPLSGRPDDARKNV